MAWVVARRPGYVVAVVRRPHEPLEALLVVSNKVSAKMLPFMYTA